MYSLEFLLVNVIVLVGAVAFTRCLRLSSFLLNALAIFLAYMSQIVLSMLLAGVALGQLNDITVIIINTIITAAMIPLALRYGGLPTKDELRASARRFQQVFGEAMSSPLTAGLVVLTAVAILWLVTLVYLLPPFDYDGLAYHLIDVASWLQAGRIYDIPFSFWSNSYPADTEVFDTWLTMFLHSDALANGGQIPFAIAGGLGVASLGRTYGLKRSSALAAGCLFVLTPIVLVESLSGYVDVAMSGAFLAFVAFLARFLYEPKVRYLVAAGLGAGLTLGIKSSGFAYVGVYIFVLVGTYIYHRWLRRDGKRLKSPLALDIIAVAFILGAPMVLLASYWYLRTWALYDNPLYPITVKALGHTIFAGQGTVQNVVVGANVPPELRGMPAWKQTIVSWTSDPPKAQGFYATDQRMGGLGVQWIYLELPALLAWTVYTLWKRRDVFLTLILPFLLILAVQPADWWSRYTMFIVAIGALAFVWALEMIPLAWVRGALRFAMAGAIMVTMIYSLTQWNFSPSTAYVAAKLPSSERSVGRLWMPQYAWVDTVPAGSHIAMSQYSADMWTAYPLFGLHYANHVNMVIATSAGDFYQQLQADHDNYVYTAVGSQYLTWAKADPLHFHPYATTPGGDVVYALSW